jgi:autotransporter-associated beta strand protein
LPVGTNNWGNFLNWQGGLIPVNDGTADIVMPDTPRDNPVVDIPWHIDSITFEGPGNYSINGSQLSLSEIIHNGTGTATFNNSLDFANGVVDAVAGPIVINGGISGATQLRIFAANGVTFDGSVPNSLSAGMTVVAGSLFLSKSSPDGAVAANLTVDGASVVWQAPNQVSNESNETLAVQNGGLADLAGHNETIAQLVAFTGGQVRSTGGVLTVTNQIVLSETSGINLGNGQLRLEGLVSRIGTAPSISEISAGTFTFAQFQNIFFVQDSPAVVELEINAPINGAGAILEKSGNGALRLTGQNTYSGGTSISAGTLIVDTPTGSGTGNGTVTVKSGATLNGDGSISGTVSMQNGAIISPTGSPGNQIGSLQVGSLIMNAGSVFKVQIDDARLPNFQNDQIVVTSNANVIGILEVQNLNSTNLPEPGDIYFILLGANTGSFANVANGQRLSTIDGSGSFIVNYGPASQFPPNAVVLSNFEQAILLGDVNGDGVVDLLDVAPFIEVLTNGPFNAAADVNQDGVVNLLDIAPFIDILSG